MRTKLRRTHIPSPARRKGGSGMRAVPSVCEGGEVGRGAAHTLRETRRGSMEAGGDVREGVEPHAQPPHASKRT
jgi:hypothetical protein